MTFIPVAVLQKIVLGKISHVRAATLIREDVWRVLVEALLTKEGATWLLCF